MTPYKLTVAPNGARLQKTDHPALPITIAETVKTAQDCFTVGANEIHLHVREDDGSHSLDADRYHECIQELNKAVPDMTIQITTESAGVFDVRQQLDCIEQLRPKAASISVREMARDPKLAARVYAICAEAHTKVQHILYTPECAAQLIRWQQDETIPLNQNDVIFVLGYYNPPVLGQPDHIDRFLTTIKGHNYKWTVCAFGKNEHACLLKAIQLGGHVRIGFENNDRQPNGQRYADNAASVSAFTALAKAHDFTAMKVKK
ncbi:3-keto-5-aminohexanoate cleavage protein [Amylibacter sp. SFDW26]|uniref:3-keto-5-aminohexanoate cleavage protein n=1 Tax=Amylibacter sp. SFDW26 TaxID=2652722 RepID=UPI0012619D5F|nr:3-keto-5-aminohexanoate cleavage protein [Amylibacter sp. SFDW26]KAB7613783.1 3-keto-5-aminohexanoate cleavage protein [Amylibacter sp. SFDW26]